MKRAEATERLEGLLERLVSGEGDYLPRVSGVWVFGSYARGALQVGDIDLAVEFDQTPGERGRWFSDLISGRTNHLAVLRRELRGGQRCFQIQVNQLGTLQSERFAPRLLWRRGDSLEQAQGRLARMRPDAAAGPAARDPAHPLLIGFEKLIPRADRETFGILSWAGWIQSARVELPRTHAQHPVTRERFSRHWSASNPRLETAHAAASYLEKDGIAPLGAGSALYSDETLFPDYPRSFEPSVAAVYFGARWLHVHLPTDLGYGVPRVVVVLNPTARRTPLQALDIRARVDKETFSELDEDGWAAMRERIAQAAHTGRLPDYLASLAPA